MVRRRRSNPHMIRLAVGVCAAALVTSSAFSQATPATGNGRTCFAPHPLPRCSGFWITELNGYQPLVASQFTEQSARGPVIIHDLPAHGSVSIGGMVNRGPSSAFGSALTLGNGSGGPLVGVEVRARRGIGARAALDLSAGPQLGWVHEHSLSDHTRGVGAGVDLSLMQFDWVGVAARAEFLRTGRRTLGGLSAGVRLGSYPAAVVTGTIALLAGWIMAVDGGPGS
jgi:hypothetical protein